MVLLKLLSENPELGFVIVKNPATGMQVREVRKGWAFGYYHSSNPQEYRILFRDAQNDISYKEHPNQEYEYLDKLRFSSPIFVLNAITEFFKSTVTKRHEKDLPNFIHTFTVNLVTVDRRSMTVISKFDKFFPDYEIKIEQISGAENLYRVNVTSKLSVHHLLNLVTILFGVVSILNQNDLDLNDGLVERLVKATNIVDAPYYIRYLVCSRCLSKGAYFKRYKSELETPGVTFFYGDTATQRKEYIRGLLSFDFPIIDVGCGEGFYAIPFAKILAKRGDHLYHAVDTDPIELAKVRGRAKQQEIANIRTYSDHHQMITALDQPKYDVIVTEVVEHMPPDQSQNLICDLIASVTFEKIIITTPNKNFNEHYMFEEGEMRHHDHHVEFTRDEFHAYIDQIVSQSGAKLRLEFIDLGDRVDSETVTQGVIITRVE